MTDTIKPVAWRWGVAKLHDGVEWRYTVRKTRPNAEPMYTRAQLDAAVAQERAEVERLRAALRELVACHTESAGWSMSMMVNRADFDAMIERNQERVDAAVEAARAALGE